MLPSLALEDMVETAPDRRSEKARIFLLRRRILSSQLKLTSLAHNV